MKTLLITCLLLVACCFVSAQQEHLVVEGNAQLTGIELPSLGGNANPVIRFGPPDFPGCLGHLGRFCRLDSTGVPDGRYDLIRYLNVEYNDTTGQPSQIDPNFDVWIEGPCIANVPGLTGFDIAYCPAGQTGPISPLSRFFVDGGGQIGLGTKNPLANLHVNGIPQPNLNGNANATMLFGDGGFPGCLGRMGRFCRLDSTGVPDGRYDLIRYLNARYNPGIGGLVQIDPNYDVWIDGPCIADDPGMTGFDISYKAAGQIGPITPLSRLFINGGGDLGLGTQNPQGNLHVNGIPQPVLNGNANARVIFGDGGFPGCLGRMGRFCRLDSTGVPDGRYDLIRYLNARYNPAIGGMVQIDPSYDVWIDGPCIANDPLKTGFDISYNAAGQAGIITPESRFFINSEGFVGFGTKNPFFPLEMASGAHCTVNGVWTNVSDFNKKYDISALSYGLDEILSMSPVAYKYKSDDSDCIGFIAQEMEKIIPEAVSGEEGHKGIGYGLISAVLVKAIQEQQEMINELKEANTDLEKKNKQLKNDFESRIKALESTLYSLVDNKNLEP